MKKAQEAEIKKPVATAPNADAFDWSQEQTTGFEATKPEDLGIPFLNLLQKGSPEVDEGHPDYKTKGIKDAKQGMVLQTVSRKIVYDRDETKPLLFIPAFYEKLYQEWKTRDNGGGFVQSHRSSVILTKTSRNEKNQDILPNGNEIKTTSYFYGFCLIPLEDGTHEWVRTILPMVSTQLKKAKIWLNLMHGIRINGAMPPMYSHAYKLTTVSESNEKGNWWGWKIEIDHILTKADQDVIVEARQIANESAKGRLQIPENTEAINADADPEEEFAQAEGRRRSNQ